jgi:hypothetical protein
MGIVSTVIEMICWAPLGGISQSSPIDAKAHYDGLTSGICQLPMMMYLEDAPREDISASPSPESGPLTSVIPPRRTETGSYHDRVAYLGDSHMSAVCMHLLDLQVVYIKKWNNLPVGYIFK